MSNGIVFDIEADGLDASRIHCLSINKDGKIITTNNYDNMRKFLSREGNVLVGHNIIRYDIPTLESILGVEIKARMVDTLIISWYLEINMVRHGLEYWGEFFGVPKPKVTDWEGLSYEEYKHRCEEDVKINTKLWDRQWRMLLKLYGSEEKAWALIDYLTFKMDCAALQEKFKWKLDVTKCEDGIRELEHLQEVKMEALRSVMPKVPKYTTKNPPAKMYKINGDLSSIGQKWFTFLEDQGLPKDHKEPVEYIREWVESNPGSVPQIKDWLYSLGWVPQTIKYVRNKETNEFKEIPQVNNKEKGGVCESVKDLFSKEPNLEHLDSLGIITHRLGILKGFITNVDEDGYVKAEIQGLTNTFRFKHKVCVNLPGVSAPYGELVRGCLTAPEGYELCGSDMSSLEDRTKQHYMWEYDPDYVREMNTPDFDPHLDLGVLAGMLTKEECRLYKEGHKEYIKRLKPVRHSAKQVNYSCTYGVTPKGIVRNTGMPLKQATSLHVTYWKRNWSVQAIAEDCIVKTFNKTKWLYNPVSGFWMSLRHDKDKFSTLNQSTGVFCFDTWVKHVLKNRRQLTGQFHDEIILCIKRGHREQCLNLINNAIKETNEELSLDRELGVDIQFGDNYACIH